MKSIVVLVALLAACGKGGDKPRKGSGGPGVEIVNQVSLPDAGPNTTGPTRDEVEPNDGNDVATPLPLGGTMRGKLDPDTDVDRYRIDIDKAGLLALALSAVDTDLVLELEDGSGTVVARSNRGGARTKEGIPNFGVAPGRYTAVVRGVPKKKPKPGKGNKAPPAEEPKPAPIYELTAQLAPPPAAGATTEHEPDEDRGTATDLIVGDTATGFVGWAGDADVWKLSVETLSAKNAIDIEISAVEGVALELDVDDAVGQSLLVRKAPRGAPLVVRALLPVVPASSPPFHYLTVKGAGSNPETAYQLRVTAKLLATDGETEPDDTPDKPFVMPNDRTVVHATLTPGDVDCFGLAPAASARTVDATIDPPNELGVVAELLVDGKVIATAPKAGKGTPAKVSGAVPPNAKAVIRVKNADANATVEASYDVTIQESGAGDNAP